MGQVVMSRDADQRSQQSAGMSQVGRNGKYTKMDDYIRCCLQIKGHETKTDQHKRREKLKSVLVERESTDGFDYCETSGCKKVNTNSTSGMK